MLGSGDLPRLSQIQAWETDHLSQAATYWSNTADAWEDAFERVAREVVSPGGMPWEGEGAAAAESRTSGDRTKVSGLPDDLRSAAAIARSAVEELAAAKRQALFAIGEAHAQGFVVGEDLSVTSTETGGSEDDQADRQARAESFAADIHSKAATLVATDHEIAGRISTAAADIRDAAFQESPERGTIVQALNFKQSPIEGGDDGDVDRHPDHPDHRTNGEWAPGNSGVDGHAAAQKTFDDMEAAGVPLVRQEIVVRVTDPVTGETRTRKYDALQPTGVPGQYIGIEHKVNKSPITENQRVVDDLVRSGITAHGTLDGEPIEVSNVAVLRVEWPPAEAAPSPSDPSGVPAEIVQGREIAPESPPNYPGWGTQLSPEEARQVDGPIGVLQDIIDQYTPPKPGDPRGTA